MRTGSVARLDRQVDHARCVHVRDSASQLMCELPEAFVVLDATAVFDEIFQLAGSRLADDEDDVG